MVIASQLHSGSPWAGLNAMATAVGRNGGTLAKYAALGPAAAR